MNKIQFTQQQLKAIEHLRLVYDHTNQRLVNKGYGAYVPLGLALVQIVTIEDFYKQDLSDYAERYHQRIFELADILYKSIYEEQIKLFDLKLNPYSEGYIKEQITHIKQGLSDNYFGILVSLVSYEGLTQALLNAGLPSGDKRVNAVKQMHAIAVDPNSHVLPKYHTNDILFHSIKHHKPVIERNEKLPIDEQRLNELLMLLIDEFDFKLDQDPIDLRGSKYPKRENLWDALVDRNEKLFDGLSIPSQNRFFIIQQFCTYSDDKTT